MVGDSIKTGKSKLRAAGSTALNGGNKALNYQTLKPSQDLAICSARAQMRSGSDGHAPTFLPRPNGTASTNLGPQSHHLLPRVKRDRKNDNRQILCGGQPWASAASRERQRYEESRFVLLWDFWGKEQYSEQRHAEELHDHHHEAADGWLLPSAPRGRDRTQPWILTGGIPSASNRAPTGVG